MLGGFVVPDGGGEGEDSLRDACGYAWWGAAAVAFEIELGFEGLDYRFDDLAEGPLGTAGPLGVVLFWLLGG